MRAWLPLALCFAAALTITAPASAVTRDEIVRLTKSGVSDDVILALIDRDKTIFPLSPDDLVALKGDGVSEAVVLAMLKSGRDEGEAAFAAQAAQAAADRNETAWLAPSFVVVGHEPDRPNSGYHDASRPDRWTAYARDWNGYAPWPGYAQPLTGYYAPLPAIPVALPPVRTVCVARVQPGPAHGAYNYLTGCPPQAQRSRATLAR
jgi:hypothetical protein